MSKRSVPSNTYNLQESIEVHNELNPKLWNSDNSLKDEVFEKLTDIADEFIKYIEIPLNIVDIEIVGSNASYNYNENSDIDLHIIVNSEVNFVEPTILRQLYNSKKNSFNDNYDLSIEGIPVELYIEDVNDGNATNGRYSLSANNWVLFPKPITYDIPDISKELAEYENKCNEVLLSNNPQDILDLVNEIYMMRKLGLAEDGEASVGNLVFKELRNQDMIPKLKDRYYELRSAVLSENKKLETSSRGDTNLSNKIDDLINQHNKMGLDKWNLVMLLGYMQNAIQENSYNGTIPNIIKEYEKLDKEYFDMIYNKKQDKKEEASLSRLYQHTKNKDTFAVIGSQDQDTKQSRFEELKSEVGKLRTKIPNIGFNYLEGTYTYDSGEQGIEDSLIVYNIPKQDALNIAKQLNQESIIWKDNNYFGFLDTNGKELGTFDKGSLTFDNQITNMFGSRLKSGNGYKPAFAFECKLVETDTTGNTFSTQHKSKIKKYPVCSIKLEAENDNMEQTVFWELVNKLKGGNADTIDSVDITNFIVENDILAYKSDITNSLKNQGLEKAYDILIDGNYAGYIGFKDNQWFGMQRTK